MQSIVQLFSNTSGEIYKFLSCFKSSIVNAVSLNDLEWKKVYDNPIEIAEILGTFIDNTDKFNLTMWICLDKDLFINVTSYNANNLIKYLYERYPY